MASMLSEELWNDTRGALESDERWTLTARLSQVLLNKDLSTQQNCTYSHHALFSFIINQAIQAGKMSRASTAGDRDRGRNTYPGPGDVVCDLCTGNKRRAVKSCLSCLASYCETHLQSHYEYPALMKHKLVTATGQLQEKICANHDKLQEVYCRTDQQCICVLCMMEEHKNHETVSAATERAERQLSQTNYNDSGGLSVSLSHSAKYDCLNCVNEQKQLGAKLLKSQQKIEGRLKKWQDLKQAVAALKHSAQTAVEENERIFTELVRSVQRRYTEVRQQIQAQERVMVTRANMLLSKLEQEVAELRRRHNELEQLSHTEDHIHFIQSWQSLSSPSGYEEVSSINVDPHSSFGPTKKAIADLKERVEDVFKGELSNVSAADSCQLTLDPNTVHRSLHLFESNTGAKVRSEPQPYPDHPARFEHWQQVLCREGLSGARYYWEVDWNGTEVDIAVSYKGIGRKVNANECSFGWNGKSWSLYCSESKCSFTHNNVSTTVPFPGSSRIGVFLDFRAGTLAFYSVSDNMTLLHKVQTTFSEPLYPGFGVWGYGSTIKLY
ncbi:hypothetical protein JZ751_008211 [Albula glossodonta]|uniref:Tripartite motif-containing protein 16-like n=1 Tax=Albula glossodonta TaxID=121402 RepID=A0A8T2MN53_9TELE|nr:hypothetical protein JZ751_008211 [Albula glossodonta]